MTRTHAIHRKLLRACALLALAALVWPCVAQAQRDPTIAPASAALATGSGEARAPAPEVNPMTVIVRDGRPYLVAGTRLLAQGQKLGEARIERISETEIWLREGGQLRKIARYSGVRRSASTRVQPEIGKP